MKWIGIAGILTSLFSLSGCATLGQLLPGGEWEASQIAQDPAVLYLHRKGSGASEVFYVASKLDAGLFKQLLSSPEGYWYYPMGKQERLEKSIDDACSQIQGEKKQYPGLALVEVTARYPTLSGGGARFKTPFRVDDLVAYGALYSRIRYPVEDGAIEVTDAVASCRDPAGRRFAMAQQRVALDFLLVAADRFTQAVARHKKDKAAALPLAAAQVRWSRFHLAADQAQLEWMTKEPMGLKYYLRERYIDQIEDSLESSVRKDRRQLASAEKAFSKLAKKSKLPPEQVPAPTEQTLTEKDLELLR